MVARKLKAVEANDGSYAGEVLAAWDRLTPGEWPVAEGVVMKPKVAGSWPLATQVLILPWEKTGAITDVETLQVALVPRAEYERLCTIANAAGG